MKGGGDKKTDSKNVKGEPGPKEERRARHWRTHEDIFGEVWLGIEEALFREPQLQAKVLFEQLLEQEPGKFTRQRRRSFERRVRAWKRRYGTEPELFFSQDNKPGDRLQLEWMHCDRLQIEHACQPLPQALGH